MCREVIKPLMNKTAFQHLKRFHVFQACSHQMETKAEHMAMGDSYDSSANGKIGCAERYVDFSHGVSDPSVKKWANLLNL